MKRSAPVPIAAAFTVVCGGASLLAGRGVAGLAVVACSSSNRSRLYEKGATAHYCHEGTWLRFTGG